MATPILTSTASSPAGPGALTAFVRSLRKSLRARLAVLYGALFLGSGAALLLLVVGGVGSSSREAPVTFSASRPALGQVAASQHGTDLHQLAVFSVLALGIMGVLSVLLGWAIAGRVLRPLRTITATAREISATNLNRRLDLGSPENELTELGSTLDELFGRLEASFESQRHFVANASHELRTPLAAERALLQVAVADPEATVASLREACGEALRLEAEQERLIDGLLTLATGERGLERWEGFDLDRVAAAVVDARAAEADAGRLRVRTALSPAPATGDPVLVASLVANLVDNALRHNYAGGEVDVSSDVASGGARLVVSNTGPPVRPEDVDRLFLPFERLAGGRTSRRQGHGLGLAVVRAIASAHGATMTAVPGRRGGLEVTIVFP
ncbi:MAG TPA: ATP-binding protein [Acidimicrobiales bacterium]|nr:ATP-binding protein [Acidimicrobiales bacterium]